MVQGASPAVADAGFGFVVFGAILLLALGLRKVAGLSWRWPGGAAVAEFGQGAAIGLGALLLAIGYCALAGTLGWGSGSVGRSTLPLGLLIVLVQVTAEEAMFRGYVQPLLVRGVGASGAVPLTAVSFAALHAVLGGMELVMLVNMLLGGILFGLLALQGGLWPAVGAHFAWNAVEQLGVGLDPNPGTGAFGAVIDLDLNGAALWGGSAAGLNASIAMGIALLAAILLVFRRRWA
nr:CPBP family intramembrane glutamic endopeptidase [Sphingomonas hankookensis]